MDRLEQLRLQKKEIERQIREEQGITNGNWIKFGNVSIGTFSGDITEKQVCSLRIKRKSGKEKWATIANGSIKDLINYISSLICDLNNLNEHLKI